MSVYYRGVYEFQDQYVCIHTIYVSEKLQDAGSHRKLGRQLTFLQTKVVDVGSPCLFQEGLAVTELFGVTTLTMPNVKLCSRRGPWKNRELCASPPADFFTFWMVLQRFYEKCVLVGCWSTSSQANYSSLAPSGQSHHQLCPISKLFGLLQCMSCSKGD